VVAQRPVGEKLCENVKRLMPHSLCKLDPKRVTLYRLLILALFELLVSLLLDGSKLRAKALLFLFLRAILHEGLELVIGRTREVFVQFLL